MLIGCSGRLSGVPYLQADHAEGGERVVDGGKAGTAQGACSGFCGDQDVGGSPPVEDAVATADAVLGSDASLPDVASDEPDVAADERDDGLDRRDAAGAEPDVAVGDAAGLDSPGRVVVDAEAGPPAEAYVSAAVIDGDNSPSLCGFTTDQVVVSAGSVIQFPTPGQLPVVPTRDGAFSPGSGVAHVACTVSGTGTFQIQLSVAIDGMGAFSVFGNVDASGNGSNVIATFTMQNQGTFRSDACTITPMYMNSMVPISGPPVAAGRIFAHIDCPAAVNMGESGIADDGAVTFKTCDAHADFLFENCGQ